MKKSIDFFLPRKFKTSTLHDHRSKKKIKLQRSGISLKNKFSRDKNRFEILQKYNFLIEKSMIYKFPSKRRELRRQKLLYEPQERVGIKN